MSTEMIIGQNKPEHGIAVDVSLDEDDYVSARHARIFAINNTGWVEDLGSTNGTWVDGVRVYGPKQLFGGEKLRVGRTTITIPAIPVGNDGW